MDDSPLINLLVTTEFVAMSNYYYSFLALHLILSVFLSWAEFTPTISSTKAKRQLTGVFTLSGLGKIHLLTQHIFTKAKHQLTGVFTLGRIYTTLSPQHISRMFQHTKPKRQLTGVFTLGGLGRIHLFTHRISQRQNTS